MLPSTGEVMASVFWVCKVFILLDFFPKGQTINGEYYTAQIRRLRLAIKEKQRGMLRKGALFHQDNVPVHTSAVAMAAIHSRGFQLLQHPPYFPDLAPSDYHLFPLMKKHLGGSSFSSDEAVMDAVKYLLEEHDEMFYQSGIMKLQE